VEIISFHYIVSYFKSVTVKPYKNTYFR